MKIRNFYSYTSQDFIAVHDIPGSLLGSRDTEMRCDHVICSQEAYILLGEEDTQLVNR